MFGCDTLHSTNIPNAPYILERFLRRRIIKQFASVCFWKCFSVKQLENHSNNLMNQFVQLVGPLVTRLSQLNWFGFRGFLKFFIWKLPGEIHDVAACHHGCPSRLVQLFPHLGIVENHLGDQTTGSELQHSVLLAWPSSSAPTCFNSCNLRFKSTSSHGPHYLGFVSKLPSISTKRPCPHLGKKIQWRLRCLTPKFLKYIIHIIFYIHID